MNKFISLAAAASLALTAMPAVAKDGSSMRVERKTIKKVEKKVDRMIQRVSRRQLKLTPKKLTPSQACKDVWGKERAACMRAFNMGKKWTPSSSSSSMSSSSMSSSSMSTSSMSSSSSSSMSSSSSSMSSSSSN